MRERSAEFHSKQHRQHINRRAQRVDAVGFFNLLTGLELLDVTESHLPEHRERLHFATMLAAGADVLFEQNGARNTDFRRGVSLGRRDHLVSWAKSKIRPEWMTEDLYAEFPDELTVREVWADGQILVTTLVNQRKVRKGALDQLYAQRWNVELDLRNIKTTLGVEVLRCHTRQMIEKELWVHLLAYNLIRLLMVQAALDADVHPRHLSFKHTVQLWTVWTAHRVDLSTDPDTLFRLIAQPTVGNRPGRIEPRARKRRPKPYPWLKNAAG